MRLRCVKKEYFFVVLILMYTQLSDYLILFKVLTFIGIYLWPIRNEERMIQAISSDDETNLSEIEL